MAINRDPAEWFDRPDRMNEVVYGVLKTSDEWLALKKTHNLLEKPHVEVVARAPTRAGAIGFIKLLREE
jgi:hypothetical protein